MNRGPISLYEGMCVLVGNRAMAVCTKMNDGPAIVRHVVEQRNLVERLMKCQWGLNDDKLAILDVSRASPVGVATSEIGDDLDSCGLVKSGWEGCKSAH